MSGRDVSRRMFGVALAAVLGGATPSSAFAQSKDVVTFAAAIFTEAGRAERMRAIVDRFNATHDKIEVSPSR